MTRDEARAQGLKRYPGKPCPEGHSGERYVGNNDCTECSKIRAREYGRKNAERARKKTREWYWANAERAREREKTRYHAAPTLVRERSKQWQLDNPEKYQENQRRAYATRKEVYKGKAIAWAKANPRKRRSIMAANRARRQNAKIPLSKPYLDWMQFIYEICPEGYEVDHIYPVNGKNSCGLHVPWNLQHLPSEVNRSKSNKLPEEL